MVLEALPAQFAGDIANNSKALFATIGSSVLALAAVNRLLVNTTENERSIKLVRNKATRKKPREWGRKQGELYGVIGRSVRMNIPGLLTYEKVSLKQHNSRLPSIHVMCEGKKLLLSSTVDWAIHDEPHHIYRAKLGMENEDELSQAVVSATASGVRRVARGMVRAALEQDDLIIGGIEAVCAEKYSRIGVELRGFNIDDLIEVDAEILSRRPETALPHLASLELETDVDIKLHAVDDAQTA